MSKGTCQAEAMLNSEKNPVIELRLSKGISQSVLNLKKIVATYWAYSLYCQGPMKVFVRLVLR